MIWFRSFHEQLAYTRAKSRATEAFSTTPSFVRIFSRVNWSFWWKKSFSKLLRRLRLRLIESSLTHLIRLNPWWTVKARTLKYRLPPLSPSLTSLKKRKERNLRHLSELLLSSVSSFATAISCSKTYSGSSKRKRLKSSSSKNSNPSSWPANWTIGNFQMKLFKTMLSSITRTRLELKPWRKLSWTWIWRNARKLLSWSLFISQSFITWPLQSCSCTLRSTKKEITHHVNWFSAPSLTFTRRLIRRICWHN